MAWVFGDSGGDEPLDDRPDIVPDRFSSIIEVGNYRVLCR